MLIPWKINCIYQIPPNDVFDRLDRCIDPKSDRGWYKLMWSMKDASSPLESFPFDGVLDRARGLFQLATCFKPEDFATVLRGTVTPEGSGTRLNLWIFPGASRIIFALIVIIVFAVGFVSETLKPVPSHVAITSGAIIAVVLGAFTLSARLRARKLLDDVMSGVLPAYQVPPWPELPDYFKNPPVRPDDETDMIPIPDPTLVEHFEVLSRGILAHRSTPNHLIRVDPGKEHLTLKFPAQSTAGYDIRIEVDDNGITIYSGELASFGLPLDEYYGRTFDTIEETFLFVRSLLSPEFRLREEFVDNVRYKACIEISDSKGKFGAVFETKLPGRRPKGVRTEKIFVNQQMPKRN